MVTKMKSKKNVILVEKVGSIGFPILKCVSEPTTLLFGLVWRAKKYCKGNDHTIKLPNVLKMSDGVL